MAADSNDSSTSDEFPDGSVVKIVDLVNASHLNGRFGVVKRFVSEQNRFEVQPTRGKGTKAIKAANLSKQGIIQRDHADFSNRRVYQHAIFWPALQENTIIPVHAFEDWPAENYHVRNQLLMTRLQWENVASLGGVTSRGASKPDFMLYWDGNDTVSPVNVVGETIKALLPKFQLSKEIKSESTIRGACVLVYSPTKTTFTSFGGGGGFPPDGTQVTSGNANRQFSLQQLLNVLKFHMTNDARRQYNAHDNPMHRMYGDMM